MKLNTAKIVERVVTSTVVAIVFAATGLIFYFIALRVGDIAKENQTYNRYISCVLSVPADDRDQAKIDHCWNEAQNDTGIEVKRYDEM